MSVVAPEPTEAAAGRAPGWRLLGEFLIRSTGFPFELVDGLRMERTAVEAAALADAEAGVDRLRAAFEADVFPRCLEIEQARSRGASAFRPWYDANRLVRRRLPLPGELRRELAARVPDAGAWSERWNGAVGHREAAEGALTETFAAELAEVRERLRGIALDPRFQEAVLLSNPDIYTVALPSYLRRYDPGRRPSKVRQLEGRLYAYLQRFCTKNDTTSFFGPIDYGRVEAGAPEPFAVDRAPGHVPIRRLTRLSYWAAEALAAAIASEPAVQPHLAARLADGCRVLPSGALELPTGAAVPLPPADAALVAGIDGRRSARELCAAAGPDGWPRLQRLRDAGIVVLRIEIPTSAFDPLAALREWVAALPPDLREPWMGRLDRLGAALASFPSAEADDKLRLLEGMEAEFSAATGGPPRRGHGAAYADRLIAYDEAQGDLRSCVVGEPLRTDLVRRLEPVLDLCAGYSALVQDACRRRARDMLLSRHGGAPQPYLSFVTELNEKVSLEDCLSDPAVARFAGRLERLARARVEDGRIRLSATDVAPLCAGGPAGTLVSPDVFLAATSPEAIARGDFQLVVGEVHYGSQVWCHFLTFHPDPARVGVELEHALPVLPAGEVRAGMVHGRSQGKTFYLEPPGVAVELRGRSLKPAGEVLPVADLEVALSPEGPILRSRSRGAVLRCHPGDPRAVANWLFGTAPVIAPPIVFGAFTPRVEIDGTVLARARWELSGEELRERLGGASGAALMTAAQALRSRHGLPERCFVRVAGERKPFFIDFANLLALEQLVTLLRDNPAAVLTELLPSPDRWWLSGPGTRSNEWRLTLAREGNYE